METRDENEDLLRSVALENARSIQQARLRAEQELLQAKEALRESNERLTSILESITDGLVVLDREWRFVYLNPRAKEIIQPLGKSSESLNGKILWQEFPDILGTPIEQNYRRALSEQCTVEFETYYPPLDSWFEVRVYPTPNSLSIYIQDIGRRKRAEEAQARLAAIVECSEDGIIGNTLEGIITSWNRGAESIFGWRAEEMIGQPITKIIPVERHPEESFILDQLRQGRRVEHYESVRVTKDGRRINVSLTSSPIRDADGRLIGASKVVRDITERKHAQEALRVNEEFLRAIFNQAAVGMAIATLDGRFTEFNEKFSQILGYSKDELLQMTFIDITHPEDQEVTRANTRRLLAGEIPDFVYEKRYVRKDRTLVWSLTTVTLLKDAAGKPQRYIGVIEDITQRKQVETERERLTNVLAKSLNEIYVFDAETLKFQYVNQSALTNLGYTLEAMQRMTPLDIKPEYSERSFRELVRPLLEGEREKIVFSTVHRRSKGADYPVEVHLQLVAHAGQRLFLAVTLDITEGKKAEQALRQSEEFNRTIIESSRDCTKTLGLDGTLLWISSTGQRALLLSDDAEVVGKSWIDFWQGEERAIAEAAVRAAAAGNSGNFVGCFPVGGQPRWWDVLITPILNADGKPEKLLAVSRDVTERKSAEEKIRRSEAELRALADSIPQLAWMANPDGHIFWYNRRWYDYTGTNLEQMQGWGWQSVHDPQILPRVIERWKQSLDTGEPFEMEFPLRGADGVYRWFLTRVYPLRDADDRVLRWFGTNTDVDHVKRIHEALQDETRILELLNQTGATLSSNLDVETLVQSVTDAATKLSGAKFGAFFYNVVNQDGEALMLYTLSGAPRAAFEKFGLPRNTPVFNATFRGEGVVRSDDISKDPRYGKMPPHHGMPKGHLPVCSYLAVPVISRSGTVIGGLFFGHPEPGVFTERHERIIVGMASQAAIAIDNARLYEATHQAAEERKWLLESERRARAEAERTNELKDEFLANLSHELRTPLSAILGWSQVLRLRVGDNPEVRQGLETIERNARVQTQLIEDLLDMSRITSGKVRLDIQPVEPVAIIEAAIETVRPAAGAKGIRLEKALDPAAGPISGDPGRLQQVIWNLLINAIKFTPKGGKVQVVLERVNSHIEISIADTGVGIKPEFLAHIFERFRQEDSSTTRRHGGLGLGLSIVKHLVELHGGTVSVKSPGENLGATFTVNLPLTVVHRPPETGERFHPRAATPVVSDFRTVNLSGVRILVVDDEPDARDLIKRVLADCQAQVFTAATAVEALEMVEQERPHVLVSDIGMPDVDGYELLKRVRALGADRGGRLPAVALTAFARSEDRTRALRAGFLIHVAKPVEPAELVATVASAAGRTGDQTKD